MFEGQPSFLRSTIIEGMHLIMGAPNMKSRMLVGMLVLAASTAASAEGDIDQLNLLSQSEFRLLSRDLGAALSYKAVTPAEPLGITGFDVGLEIISTRLEYGDIFDRASSDDVPNSLFIPKLHLHKGLPGGVDLGAFYSSIPGSNIAFWGAEARYAFLKGGTLSPAISLRGTYSRLSGVDQLDVDTTGLELSISKGFANFTPYAGLGRVWIRSTPNAGMLVEEDFSEEKYFLGANLNFGIFNMDLEGDRTGDTMSYSLKFGWRF